MNTWAPLWNGIVDSSIWDEPDYVIKIFLTMMAIKDMDHVVRFSAYQIGRKSRKDEQEVLDALKILSSPDKRRKEKQQFDGRRIKAVEEGWLILNGEKYRALVSLEMKRARDRKAQKKFREKQKAAQESMAKSKPLPGEDKYVNDIKKNGLEAADAAFDRNQIAESNNGQ